MPRREYTKEEGIGSRESGAADFGFLFPYSLSLILDRLFPSPSPKLSIPAYASLLANRCFTIRAACKPYESTHHPPDTRSWQGQA
jgi:hypothetical protein